MFIGCQFSIYPMSDNYKEIITKAIKNTHSHDVRILTDDISTTVIGNINNVFTYITNCYINCLEIFNGHIAMNCLFSIGCPGEDDDKICHSDKNFTPMVTTNTNLDTAAQFSLMGTLNTQLTNFSTTILFHKILNRA